VRGGGARRDAGSAAEGKREGGGSNAASAPASSSAARSLALAPSAPSAPAPAHLVPMTAPLPEGSLLHVLAGVPRLVTLYLKGNPCVRETRHYRKQVVSGLQRLRYLDERPIFDNERASTAAWAAGGVEAERAEVRRLEEAKRSLDRSQTEKFAAWQSEVRAKRARELAAHNEALRAAGEPEVAELPRKTYVSYQRVSTGFQTETMRLQRLAERAEKAAKAGGLHETAMMDLGREWWAEEGVLDADGNLVKKYPEGQGPPVVGDGGSWPPGAAEAEAAAAAAAAGGAAAPSAGGGASASAPRHPGNIGGVVLTEKGEEEEERAVIEAVHRLERRERIRLRAAARRAHGGPDEGDEDELETPDEAQQTEEDRRLLAARRESQLVTSVNVPARARGGGGGSGGGSGAGRGRGRRRARARGGEDGDEPRRRGRSRRGGGGH